VTHGAGRLACLRRVCYKFVAEFGLTDNVPFINFSCSRNNCKLVYYGFQVWRKNRQPAVDLRPHGTTNQKGKMVSIATETDRTPFFRLPAFGFGKRCAIQNALSPIYRAWQVFYEASAS